jgi:hypothetical protein
MKTPPFVRSPRPAPDSGQALVETAITMPLFVFIMLGTLQLGLMHQAHALTKYAAYKAVRAGALHNAKKDVMELAAAAVLIPMVSWESNGVDIVSPVTDGTSWVTKLIEGRLRAQIDQMKIAEVKICGPTKQTARMTGGISSEAQKADKETQFDAPWQPASSSWRESERNKLRVEVTFNYRLPIPFANGMIYWIARGQENSELLFVTRTGFQQTQLKDPALTERARYDEMARLKLGYILPIRATYTMRMMSDLYPDGSSDYELPDQNTCHIPWAKKSGGE